MDLTYKVLEQRVKAMAATRTPICRRWDFYNNDVSREPYFPALTDELPEEYKRRFKIGVGWCGAIANRLASYFRKGPIEIRFDIDGDGNHPLAREASAVWADTAGINGMEAFMVDVARDAGVGSDGYTKERYELYNADTGQILKTRGDKLGWLGQIKIGRVNNSFVYRAWDRLGVTYIEAWVRLPSGEYRLLGDLGVSENSGGLPSYEYIEAIRPGAFDILTGKPLVQSGRAIFEDKVPTYTQPVPYSRPPLQRFANMVSRPESEDGISDIEWAIPLAHAINHIISGAVRSVHYHGWPQMYASGLADGQNIVRGPESLMILPAQIGSENPEVGVLTWDQNLSGAMELQNTLGDFMSAITGVPKHTLEGLDGAGSVVSGVALRLMYHNMNEACKLKETGFRGAEEEMILTTLQMLAHHNNRPGYFDGLKVSVKYNPDRTPRDRSAELDEDLKLLTMRISSTPELFLKHRGPELGIATYEDALKHYKEVAEWEAKIKAITRAEAPDNPPPPPPAGEGKEGEEDEDGEAAEGSEE